MFNNCGDVITYLDGALIDQDTVELLVSDASASRVSERDVGNASALRVGSVDDINSFDGTDSLTKVILGAKTG